MINLYKLIDNEWQWAGSFTTEFGLTFTTFIINEICEMEDIEYIAW